MGTTTAETTAAATAVTGRRILLAAAVVFLAVVLPVVIRGEPLADDYHTCLRPTEVGYGGFLGESADRMGMVRPARFLEIAVIAPLCQRVPFGLVILVPLALTFAVAHQLRHLLRDLGVAGGWPEIAAALWLLHPLGSEAALWPSALHVPLGLALALGALRLYRRGALGWASVLTVAACWSVEQVVLALPLAVWLVTPPGRRRAATLTSALLVVAVVLTYTFWPGTDPRADVAFTDRFLALFADPQWYVLFPAVGVGAHAIPMAVRWAFPVSIAVLAVGAWLGVRYGPRLLAARTSAERWPRATWLRGTVMAGALVVLVNVPLATTLPRGYTPRTFTPTWLLLAALMPLAASRVRWSRPRLVGLAAGLWVAGAVLALSLSSWVRVNTADFTVASSAQLAALVPDEGVVAVCGVRRTAVEPAPFGSFAIHELAYDWSAQAALRFHTGRRAEVRLGGPLWDTRCPSLVGADAVVEFDELLQGSPRG